MELVAGHSRAWIPESTPSSSCNWQKLRQMLLSPAQKRHLISSRRPMRASPSRWVFHLESVRLRPWHVAQHSNWVQCSTNLVSGGSTPGALIQQSGTKGVIMNRMPGFGDCSRIQSSRGSKFPVHFGECSCLMLCTSDSCMYASNTQRDLQMLWGMFQGCWLSKGSLASMPSSGRQAWALCARWHKTEPVASEKALINWGHLLRLSFQPSSSFKSFTVLAQATAECDHAWLGRATECKVPCRR